MAMVHNIFHVDAILNAYDWLEWILPDFYNKPLHNTRAVWILLLKIGSFF